MAWQQLLVTYSVPLIAAVFGSALTIVGQAIGPFLQRKTTSEEAARLTRQLRRDKAELIYHEIELAKADGARATAAAAKMLTSSGESLNMVASVGRLRGLMAIYFPQSRQLFSSFDKKISAHGEWMKAQVGKRQSQNITSDEVKGITYAYCMLLNNETAMLTQEARSFMDQQAPSLFP